MNVAADDPWSVQIAASHGANKPTFPSVATVIVNGIEPLDEQIGIISKRTVPEKLHDALFGQPTDRVTQPDDNPSRSINTYAILDAAKIPGLAGALDCSGLEHRCLFIGDAFTSLKDVAPWIVTLEDDNRFVRNLFTQSDASWHLWDSSPAVYLRSPASLDELWKHFRKFIRVRDENGKWFYQRFWEPQMLAVYSESEASPFDTNKITSVIATGKDNALIVTLPSASSENVRPILTERDRRRHADQATRVYSEQLARKFHLAMPRQMRRLGISDSRVLAPSILRICSTLSRLGITRAADVARLAACSAFYGTNFLNDPRLLPLTEQELRKDGIAASLRALRFEQALRNHPLHVHVTSEAGFCDLIDDLSHRETGQSLPSVPMAQFGIETEAMWSSFLARCQMSWQRAGLPIAEQSSRRDAQTRIALLWGAEFLQDPLHQDLATNLIRCPHDDISPIMCQLKQRAEKGWRDG